MPDFLMQYGMLIFWVLIAVIALIVEVLTDQLVSCWFIPSALIAMIMAPFKAPIWAQVLVFFGVSILLIFVARRFVKKKIDTKKQDLNADRLIGKTGVVQETINNISETGSVKIAGLVWAARSENGEEISAGEIVVIRDIQGVKLICSPAGKT